ncbi:MULTISPECIES: TolB family protein [unclassified Lysobacter]
MMLVGLALALALASPPHGELFGSGLFSTQYDDAHITFDADGRTAYFLRSSPDFAHWTTLVSHQRDGRWQPPEVASFSGRYSDADVFIDFDGSRMLFISNRPIKGTRARPDTEIWAMRRTPDGWGPPRHVSELSSPGNEWFPTMTRDGWLYFGSEREGGHGKSDLWRARWDGERFLQPQNLGPVINTADQEIEAYVDPDGRYLVFAAKGRQPGAGGYDLYVTYRCARTWSRPRALGAATNSAGWDFGPRIDPSGKYLYFTSNRSTFRQGNRRYDMATLTRRLASPGNGLRDIYRVAVDALGLDAESPCD